MTKTVKVSLTILMACIFSVSMALAADQKKKRDRETEILIRKKTLPVKVSS
ncbi:hypothetical protein [uncultured Desulfobacter sp.]|uniref:hypothetical protein n=1 Tax=uncultured Desulfobacter sp. TaxID=240139 RepID=UPI0029C936A5|nr:hypothetical protein [uncultured Desulfobacter sp.]